LCSFFQENGIMHVNLFFDGLSNGELLKFKIGPPCIKFFTTHKMAILSKTLVYIKKER